MVTARETHDVAVLAPWYVAGSQNVAIHRYLDPSFVAQFQADVSNAPQKNTSLFDWQSEDQVSPTDMRLKLRRPVHRTFHMVAWEASCKMATAPAGYPAIEPEKIASAGFVMRDVSGASPQGFYICKGKSQGWAPVLCTKADPDAARHLRSLSLVPRQATPSPCYTGEETFPLHPLSVTTGGKPHTLLYGYLPIGGGDFVPQVGPCGDVAPQAASPSQAGTPAEELPWPFGLVDHSGGPPTTYVSDQQISNGQIQPAMAAFLRLLLGRYQLVDPTAWDPDDPSAQANLHLIALLNTITFFPDPPPQLTGQALRTWAADNALSGVSLGSVLQNWAQFTLQSDLSLVALTQSNSIAQTLLSKLNEAYPTGSVDFPTAHPLSAGSLNLLVVESVATQLRNALQLRLAQATTVSTSALPTPKLTSGLTGNYVVQPFVRVIRPDGCEKVFWGAPSLPFAVAAMFDTDAARPTLIEMPDLADAKKGLAKGAAFSMPPNLADLANGMSTSSAISAFMSTGAQPSGGLGIGYICSFSLPAISICAMIALSIILSLLNIFLGWMAWVKICLPIPVKK
jgi:hypothetical protein